MHLMVWSCKRGRKKCVVWNSKMRLLLVKEKRMVVGHCFRAWKKKKSIVSEQISIGY
ncbi:hypothetical protein GLYMA_01G035500v4 [Glycine max]|uniref:Uncharacterized protein n=1 Tax=Glycine max TaxID=3847 RepID=K7K1L0_SOYBN|nr:hypothetical protein JHK85_000336 [Glycine max]KAH1161460.1 hypothetical protein GYH30_000364 [Glycine max]KRH74674.1 hypothetical protein GLYMA_01G035500v4 [Glycine max]